jgi:hypothetical protein
MLRLFIVIVECRYLATIYNFKNVKMSSVYHNYSGLLNIGALLQKAKIVLVFTWTLISNRYRNKRETLWEDEDR